MGWFRRKPEPAYVPQIETKYTLTLPATTIPQQASAVQTIDATQLAPYAYAGQYSPDPWESSVYDGGKFYGGFGATQLFDVDYWTLRERSGQLFTENLYARGVIRRLITNEINTGLTPEACPEEATLGLADDSLDAWTEQVETRFGLWSKSKKACDVKGLSTFAALQRTARLEALVGGDVLVVIVPDSRSGLPRVRLVGGGKVRTPTDYRISDKRKIVHGVEQDAVGRHIAFHILQADGSYKRQPAFGASGRALAWLVYGTERRLDEVRGQPLLSVVLQSLKEVDRYRDSVQRKAVINSLVAMIVKKNADKMGSLPMTGGAVRRGQANVVDIDGTPRKFNLSRNMPGMVIEELQVGEEPQFIGGQGTDINLGPFEEVIMQAVAWANEIPPEILRLAFSNNYSASQAAINEFKIYLNKFWAEFGDGFCAPIYEDWLISEVLNSAIRAPGLLEAWRDPSEYAKFGAWVAADWLGSIKPSTDMVKQGKASAALIKEGLTTRAREARITTGTKYSKNVKRLKRENEQLVETRRAEAEFNREFTPTTEPREDRTARAIDSLVEALEGANVGDEFIEGFIEALNDA